VRYAWQISLYSGLLLLAGCASYPLKTTPSSPQQPIAKVSAVKATIPKPPSAVLGSLLPKHGLVVPEQIATTGQAHFDVSVNNLPARQFFLALAKGAPYNVVVSRGVSGRITLHLKNVTLSEVMQTVERVYGYTYNKIGNTWIVLSNEIQSRIFHINYLDIVRKATSKTRVTSGQTTNADTAGLYGVGGIGGLYGGGGGYGGLGGRSGQSGGRPLVAGSSVTTKSKSNFWKSISTALKAIVGSKGGSKVVINPSSGVIVVRAMPRQLQEVGRFIHAVQNNVNREVIIEAKILEVTLNHSFQSGINWSQLMKAGSSGSVLIGQVAGQSLFNTGESSLQGLPITVQPNPSNPLLGFPTSAFGGTFAAALNLGDFNAFIELLKGQGAVHVLSSPRMATINNQDAIIKVGHDEFFVTSVNSNTIAGTATTSSSNINLTPFFSGVALDVTPQISAKGWVTLYIHPTVSKVTDQNKIITVNGQQNNLPLAFSSVRESDSIVRARSGQVVVIGGLMKKEVRNQTYSVPLLGDIPMLGYLFRQQKQLIERTELVILLKPIVVGDGDVWAHYTRERRAAAARLKPGS